jgi:leucyl aminopeptidase
MESRLLPVRLRVLIPAVDKRVLRVNAYRPWADIIRTRKGLAVEVGNSDAEGRLSAVRRDRWRQTTSNRDLMIGPRHTAGAARVALGRTCPAVFGSKQSTGGCRPATLAATVARPARADVRCGMGTKTRSRA